MSTLASTPVWSGISFRTDEPAPLAVRIERIVVQEIERETLRHLHRPWPAAAQETGGLLAGRWWHGALSVRRICGPAEGASHDRYRFDNGDDARREFDRDLWGSGLRQIGDWHVHPRRGETTPSDTDVHGWAAAYELFADESRSAPAYLGLIVTPANPSWPRRAVNLSAWVTSCDRRGDLVCKPTTVHECKEGRVFWEHTPYA